MFLYYTVYVAGVEVVGKEQRSAQSCRSASKTFGITLPTIDDLYESYVAKKTEDNIKDPHHPLRAF